MTDDLGPSIDGTRLTAQRYLDLWAADVTALAEAAAENLSAAVPGCPEWTVEDLVSHVIGVYRHKTAALEAGRAPDDPETGGWGTLQPGEDPIAALQSAYAELRQRLVTRAITDPAWTWWPGEQTVGFWVRRMAQETAVHRWDAQSAVHGSDGAAPIPDDLADDGIDEVLGWLRWEWPDDLALPGAGGQRIAVSSSAHSWTVTVDPTCFAVEAGAPEEPLAAAIVADPSSLLLDLWGRPAGRVAVTGDLEAIGLMRARLRDATG